MCPVMVTAVGISSDWSVGKMECSTSAEESATYLRMV